MTDDEKLNLLIKRLDEGKVLGSSEVKRLSDAQREKTFQAIMAGKTYGEASGGLAILNQPEEQFRSELKSIDNDLGAQVDIVNEALDGWYDRGELPPPYYAWRIAVILSKAKRKDDEAAFLNAWCKHFGAMKGGRYEALAIRARKLGK